MLAYFGTPTYLLFIIIIYIIYNRLIKPNTFIPPLIVIKREVTLAQLVKASGYNWFRSKGQFGNLILVATQKWSIYKVYLKRQRHLLSKYEYY